MLSPKPLSKAFHLQPSRDGTVGGQHKIFQALLRLSGCPCGLLSGFGEILSLRVWIWGLYGVSAFRFGGRAN